MLDQYTDISSHLLKCLATNHLSPCGSEFYKCLIQQQRSELPASLTELDLAGRWAKSWQPFLLEALTSEVTLLQTNSSTHLLPCTFKVFPSAMHHLVASLNDHEPGHLHAWACISSSYRAINGCSPWALQGSSTFKTLQLALGSADDKTRLAALGLLCCSPKTRDIPTAEEINILKEFLPQNLNCDSSPFRQHLQAAVRRFLVRIRDGCLAHVRAVKSKKREDVSHKSRKDVLDQGIGEGRKKLKTLFKTIVRFLPIFLSFVVSVQKVFFLSCRLCGVVRSASIQLSVSWTQLSEEEDGAIVAVCSPGDVHRHLEP